MTIVTHLTRGLEQSQTIHNFVGIFPMNIVDLVIVRDKSVLLFIPIPTFLPNINDAIMFLLISLTTHYSITCTMTAPVSILSSAEYSCRSVCHHPYRYFRWEISWKLVQARCSIVFFFIYYYIIIFVQGDTFIAIIVPSSLKWTPYNVYVDGFLAAFRYFCPNRP